jgi:hypothetical protein
VNKPSVPERGGAACLTSKVLDGRPRSKETTHVTADQLCATMNHANLVSFERRLSIVDKLTQVFSEFSAKDAASLTLALHAGRPA